MKLMMRTGMVVACVAWTCALQGAGAQSTGVVKSEPAIASATTSEKQRKLVDDMDKLVQMTAELKVSVDKSSKNELSLDVVRKAEAVEKLARSVKERIREAR